MMPEDTDFSATKGETSTADSSRITKAIFSSNLKTSWSRLKDPRIVRVSKAFGGKDRHSKVYTVRGLRDRRVRLSVPTAIQLYDLQDRLGLNQPSKVVDWLLNEAKHEIEKLPPLQIPQGSGLIGSQSLLLHHPMFMYDSQHQQHHEFLSAELNRGLESSNGISWGKGKDVSGETSSHRHEDCVRNQEEERSHLQLMRDDHENQSGLSSSSTMSDFLYRPRVSFQGLLSGSLPHNPIFRWDPSDMNVSQVPQRRHELSTSQTNNEDLRHHHSFSFFQLPSIPSVSHISGTNTEFELKRGPDLHSLQLSNSSVIAQPANSDSQRIGSFSFGMTANLLPSQNSIGDEQNSHNHFRQ